MAKKSKKTYGIEAAIESGIADKFFDEKPKAGMKKLMRFLEGIYGQEDCSDTTLTKINEANEFLKEHKIGKIRIAKSEDGYFPEFKPSARGQKLLDELYAPEDQVWAADEDDEDDEDGDDEDDD